MTTATLSSPPQAFESWYQRFQENHDRPGGLPWHDPYLLTASERRAVARSIQQFQLGEGARGRGLIRRATAHRGLASDPWFLPALELFIAEEQGHSRMLGDFLDRERIPRLVTHWIDAVFRRLRKLAGLEICALTLVTAEVLAIPFYRALRDATRSPLLRSICVRILCDEAAHLTYQGLILGSIRRPLAAGARTLHALFHSTFFHAVALLIWQQHHRVFFAAGWNFRRYWTDARRSFAFLQRRIRQVAADRAVPIDDLRLD